VSVFSDAHCILKTAVGKFNRKQPRNYHGAASVYPATGLYWQRGSGLFAAITNSRQQRAAQVPVLTSLRIMKSSCIMRSKLYVLYKTSSRSKEICPSHSTREAG
jgi:hypothetical protein